MPEDAVSPGERHGRFRLGLDPALASADAKISPKAVARMAKLASRHAWPAYSKLAAEAGSFFPWAEINCVQLFNPYPAGDNSLRLGMELSGEEPFEFLHRMGTSFDGPAFRIILSRLMQLELAEDEDPKVLAAALSLGADPLWGPCPAAACAAMQGKAAVLRLMLEHGLDPNAEPPGELPLIIQALQKERAFFMGDKMKCARLLWESGASLLTPFSAPSGPGCFLELLLNIEGRISPGRTALGGPWTEFHISYNYFDEAGIPPGALLPEPTDAPSCARLRGLLNTSEIENNKDWNPNPIPGAQDWALRAGSHSWFAAAIELLSLRDTPAPSAARARHSL